MSRGCLAGIGGSQGSKSVWGSQSRQVWHHRRKKQENRLKGTRLKHACSFLRPDLVQITAHGHFAYSSPDMNCSREPPICDMHLYTLCLWVALFYSLSPGVPAEHKYAACWGLVLDTKGLHICMNFSPNSCAKSVCTLLRQLPAPNQKLGILLRRWDHCNSQSQWSHAPKSLLTSRHHKYLKGSGDASVKRLKQHFLTLYYT